MSPETLPARFVPAALTSAGAGTDTDRARAAGYAAGWAAGSRAAAETAAAARRAFAEEHVAAQAHRDAAVADALVVLERAVTASCSRTAPVVAEARRTLYDAALDLAAAVLGRELTPGPASARALLDRVLAESADLGIHTVRVSAADLPHLRAVLAGGPSRLPDGVELVADPLLAPGDAVCEHPAGYLDARIGAALARARAVLLGEDVA